MTAGALTSLTVIVGPASENKPRFTGPIWKNKA
jgi:hypothetical protein